jgi:hypothetical protein
MMRYKAVLVGAILAFTSNCILPNDSVAESFMLVAAETIPGSNPANQTPVLRFEVEDTGPLVPISSIPANLLNDPDGVVFSPWGELFVGNRHGNVGGGTGSISRFTFDGSGNFIPNGTITNGLDSVHDMAFSPTGELFAVNSESNTVSRFIFDGANSAIPNGVISTGVSQPLGVAVSAAGEVFVTLSTTGVVSRFVFDPIDNHAVSNGSFTIPGAGNLTFPTFNADGELFLPDASANKVWRYTFDAGGAPSANGSIGVADALGVAFSPLGELFVSRHASGGIARFTFDGSGTAEPNGLMPTNTLGGLAILVPEPSSLILLAGCGAACLRRQAG